MREVMKETNTLVDHTTNYVKSHKREVKWQNYRSVTYWEYRKKWEQYPKRHYVDQLPIHLDIETTTYCNLKCPMCPRTVQVDHNQFEREYMPFEFFKNLIDQAAGGGICSVKLNYLGEPLVHKDVVEHIRYAKEKGMIDVIINTNAVLLTESMSKAILEAGIDGIFFSFDSPYKEAYENVRIGANYERVINNIKDFVGLRDEMGFHHVQSRVSMVKMKDNLRACEDFVAMWEPYVDMVGFITYYEHLEAEDESNSAFQYWGRDKPIENFCCPQPFQRMFVMVDGTVTACCVDSSRGKLYPLGNAKTQSLKEIWNSEAYRRLRQVHAEGNYCDIDMCSRCPFPYLPDH